MDEITRLIEDIDKLELCYFAEEETLPVNSDKFLEASKHWKQLISNGDKFLEATDDVVKKTKGISTAHWRTMRRGLAGVKNSLSKFERIRDKTYGQFADGRTAFNAALKAWKLPEGPGKKGFKSKPLSSFTSAALVAAVMQEGPRMHKAMRDFLEAISAARKVIREVAKKQTISITEAEKIAAVGKRVIKNQGVAFYARANGLLRKIHEFLRRAQKHEKFEDIREDIQEVLDILNGMLVKEEDSAIAGFLEKVEAL
jgi:hypothetical protein